MIELVLSDAVPILRAVQGQVPALFTGLPDAAEVGGDVDAWRPWYDEAMGLTLGAIAPGGAGVIYATDRRADGGIQSKAGVILRHAERLGLRVLWHKVVAVTMGTSLYRPSYSHLIAVANGPGVTAGKATPDIMEGGAKDYPNALGHQAIDAGLALLSRVKGASWVFDPFVGRASILAAAEGFGWGGVGVEIDPDQIDLALAHYGDRAARLDAADLLWRLA